jgi:hypothetical protein
MKYLKKVISGGQSGADRSGLDAAKTFGIPTGGTAPKNYKVTDYYGNDSYDTTLKEFGLVESSSSEWNQRTIQNVENSTGTVWFGYQYSGGALLTFQTCRELFRPILINPNEDRFVNWMITNKIEILNVAGSAYTTYNPDIRETVYGLLVSAFAKLANLQQS